MKVTAILKGRTDQNNQVPIQIRINDGSRRRYASTKMKVEKRQFKKGRVVDHPKAGEYNSEIKRLIILYQAAGALPEQKKEKSVYAYIDEISKLWQHEKGPGTMRYIRSQTNVLKEYSPVLNLSGITKDFLDGYKTYRYETTGSKNTVWSTFKFLRTIVNAAINDNLIKEDPFKGFKRPKYKDPEKVYLVESELKKIETYLADTCTPEMQSYGWWFLIACWTGLRMSDILRFNKATYIRSHRMVLHTTKTSEIVSLPLSEAVAGYLENVGYKGLGVSEKTYREKIKEVVRASGISKKVSTHTARHTFGCLCAAKGVSKDVASKFMGIAPGSKTIDIYYKLAAPRLDDEYQRLF